LLALAREAIRLGGALPAVLNAANEIAVAAFLADRIRFGSIYDAVANTMTLLHHAKDVHTLHEILAFDAAAREAATRYLAKD
jgi:1-deoxy-D-xylulose-5-phosphate reductoisomerase